MSVNYKRAVGWMLLLAVCIRLLLIFLTPISMFQDPIIRFLPHVTQALNLDFSFFDPPLFIICEAFWALFLSGKWLWLAWKATSLIFFMAILSLLPALFEKLELSKEERIVFLALFLFSAWPILLSVTVMQDMMLAFLALVLFFKAEDYLRKPDRRSIFMLVLATALVIFTKASGYIILCGFGLYILGKKRKEVNIKRKIKAVLYMALGAVIAAIWPLKNYILTGRAFMRNDIIPAISLHSVSEYVGYLPIIYHYYWWIPLPSKVQLSGIFASLYNEYYFAALFITAIISLFFILGLFKYGRKYKEYVLLLLPLFGFAIVYWALILFWGPHDVGRYTFPLWLFLFLFPVKLICSIQKERLKRLAYVAVACFCIISVISSAGVIVYMNTIDSQILEMSGALDEQNAQGAFITNNEFTISALGYYLGGFTERNSTGTVDPALRCGNESSGRIFSSKNFDVYKDAAEYRICRH